MTLEGWTRVYETDTHEVWVHRDGSVLHRTYDTCKGTWTSSCGQGTCSGDRSEQLKQHTRKLDKAFSLSDGGTRPLPQRLLKLERTLHVRCANSLDELMRHVSLQRGTVLAYLLQLVSERPYGETTRLVARLLPSELLRQLLRVEPSVLYGRLRPLVHTLDSTMGRAWRTRPHKYAELRLARECQRKKKARQRINPSERCVIGTAHIQ